MKFEPIELAFLILSLLISIIGHEIMHGLAALYYGDTTAKDQHRLSINPLRHIDPIGTLILPTTLYFLGGFIFGYAKPVPIFMQKVVQNKGYKAALLVSLAGILYNLTLAFISLFLLKHTAQSSILHEFFYILAFINLLLGLFNLYPIPPLDGFKALNYILRMLNLHKFSSKLEKLDKYGFVILILLIATPASTYFFMPIKYIISTFFH